MFTCELATRDAVSSGSFGSGGNAGGPLGRWTDGDAEITGGGAGWGETGSATTCGSAATEFACTAGTEATAAAGDGAGGIGAPLGAVAGAVVEGAGRVNRLAGEDACGCGSTRASTGGGLGSICPKPPVAGT